MGEVRGVPLVEELAYGNWTFKKALGFPEAIDSMILQLIEAWALGSRDA